MPDFGINYYEIDCIEDDYVFYHKRRVMDGENEYRNVLNLRTGEIILPKENTRLKKIHYYNWCFELELSDEVGSSKHGLVDLQGRTILSPIYDEIDVPFDITHGIVVQYEGRMGVKNSEGKELLPIVFDYISSVGPSSSFFIVRSNGKEGIIDVRGNCIIPLCYDGIKGSRVKGETLYAVRSGSKWGYYDIEERRMSIPLSFDKVEPFYDNSAKVMLADMSLYIDRDGHPIVPKGYGHHREVRGNRVVLCDTAGNVLPEKPFPYSHKYDRYEYKVNGKCGLCDSEGNIITPPLYEEIEDYHFDKYEYCPAKKGYWGVISKNGDVIIPFDYRSIWISDGLLIVNGVQHLLRDGWAAFAYGCLDRWNHCVLPIEYTGMSYFHKGLSYYSHNRGYGIMDKFGNRVEYSIMRDSQDKPIIDWI